MVDYNDAERYQRSEKWRDIPCIGRFNTDVSQFFLISFIGSTEPQLKSQHVTLWKSETNSRVYTERQKAQIVICC